MEAYAHQVFNTWSRHDSSASHGGHTQAQPGARILLARSHQSQLTAGGSGVIRYEPTGYYIDGGDFTKFFQEAHANTNVTGAQTSTLMVHPCLPSSWLRLPLGCAPVRMQPEARSSCDYSRGSFT